MSAVNIAFTAPVAIDPRTSPNSRIRTTHVIHDQDAVVHDVEYLDANGNVIFTESQRFEGAAVATWIAGLKNTTGNMVLVRKGTTGTIT